jgi:hypothetical protein
VWKDRDVAEVNRQELYRQYARMSVQEQRSWLDDRIRENSARRLRECEARGHVVEADEDACPHCDTPYSEIEDRKP